MDEFRPERLKAAVGGATRSKTPPPSNKRSHLKVSHLTLYHFLWAFTDMTVPTHYPVLSNELNRGYENRQYLRQYPIVWMCYMKPASLPMMKKGSEGEISPALITRSRSLSNQLKAS